MSDGHGRATTYRIAGTEAVDLAGAVDFVNPDSETGANVVSSSTHKESSSTHNEPSSTHSEDSDPSADPQLLRIAAPVRGVGRATPDKTREIILELCRDRFLSVVQLATLLDRSPQGLRERFVKPMTDEGLLKRRFPNQPNHEQQAYTAGSE